MKTLITTLNSKYIHSSLAIRLLYVVSKDTHDTSFKEYTIKDKIEDLIKEMISYDHVALGCYIWNIEPTLQLIKELKMRKPEIIITLGGPEVSYDALSFLGENVDFIISGEGEFVFKELLDCLENKQPITHPAITFRKEGKVIKHTQVAMTDLDRLITYDSPYDLIDDVKNQIIYFESSRGCPYQCSYCLSSLENGVRFFSEDYVFSSLSKLNERGARTIKFLDRTFNIKRDHAKRIFDFIIKNHKEAVYQFEITGELLPEELILHVNQHAPKGLFRFEIGIQSTNEETNRLVHRFQNWDKLKRNIQLLQDAAIIDLHLDLIAGLPKEDYPSFIKTFDDVFSLRPHELQLGFLKMLRGTRLRREAERFGYVYDAHAPYELISSGSLSPTDIKEIKWCEEGLEKYWNSGRFSYTMNYLIEQYSSPFELFKKLGSYWVQNNHPFHRFQLDELYERLYLALKEEVDASILLSLLKVDYLTRSKIKPKRFWETFDKKTRNEIIRNHHETLKYNVNELYKLALVDELSIDYQALVKRNEIIPKKDILFTVFSDEKEMITFKTAD